MVLATNMMANANVLQDGAESTALHLVRFLYVCNEDMITERRGCVECDSLAEGDHRRLREDGKSCECKDGWGGINCNGALFLPLYCGSILKDRIIVCETDNACVGFPLLGAGEDDDSSHVSNMTCYKGGETVFTNHQMCDVTSEYCYG